jgi:hypothetical protein
MEGSMKKKKRFRRQKEMRRINSSFLLRIISRMIFIFFKSIFFRPFNETHCRKTFFSLSVNIKPPVAGGVKSHDIPTAIGFSNPT